MRGPGNARLRRLRCGLAARSPSPRRLAMVAGPEGDAALRRNQHEPLVDDGVAHRPRRDDAGPRRRGTQRRGGRPARTIGRTPRAAGARPAAGRTACAGRVSAARPAARPARTSACVTPVDASTRGVGRGHRPRAVGHPAEPGGAGERQRRVELLAEGIRANPDQRREQRRDPRRRPRRPDRRRRAGPGRPAPGCRPRRRSTGRS